MRRFTRFVSAVAASIIVLMSAGAGFISADNTMTAEQQVEAISVGWNLGNTFDSYGTWINNVTPYSVETAWGNPETTREMLAAVRQRGFNAIRIPVTWAQFMDDEGHVDDAWMARVRQVVDWSLEEGLYVILNVHHDTGEHGDDKVCWLIADTGNYESNEGRFATLWTEIADEFKDYDNRLMFEGYNEFLDMNNTWNSPSTGTGAYDAVNSYAQLFVDTVRATGGNNSTRNLIVNTYVASVDQVVLDSFVLPDDSAEDHLICEVHAYVPWNFCSHDGDASYTTFDDNCRNEIDNVMTRLSAFSESRGVPVIIGEFACESQNNDSDRASYAAYFTSRAAEEGIRVFWWDNGSFDYGNYAILDRSSLTWTDEIASALVDNAPDGTAPAVTETSETTETTAAETSEATEATASAAVTEVAETAVNTDETEVSGADNSQSVNGNHKSLSILLIVGGVVVAASYVGLFMLGRKMGRNKRGR